LSLARAACLGLALATTGVAAAPGGPLRLSVAVSLRPALEEALELYRSENPGAEIELNGGASGVLVQQLRRGAPADALLAASSREIDLLCDEGLALAPTRRAVAANALVIVVRRGLEPPAGVQALGAPRYRSIAVGNPKTAPLGRYTRQALAAAGLESELAPRLVYAENARQTVEYVGRAEVDAGIVYRTDAASYGDRLSLGPELPGGLHDPIVYEAVVLSGSHRRAETEALLAWLVSPRGREALERHGFRAP